MVLATFVGGEISAAIIGAVLVVVRSVVVVVGAVVVVVGAVVVVVREAVVVVGDAVVVLGEVWPDDGFVGEISKLSYTYTCTHAMF